MALVVQNLIGSRRTTMWVLVELGDALSVGANRDLFKQLDIAEALTRDHHIGYTTLVVSRMRF